MISRSRRMLAVVLSTFVIGIFLSILSSHQVAATPSTSVQLTLAPGWPARYNGSSNGIDTPYDLIADNNGNVYVTGTSASTNGSTDYATVKYDSHGTQLWATRYNGPGSGNDTALRAALDTTGNVYVTGASAGVSTGQDITTIKYSPSGQQLWAKRYNGPGNGDDSGNAITIDSHGNVYVTGASVGVGTGSDATTIKYDANGNQLWIQRFDKVGTSSTRNDSSKYLVLDPSGAIYVIGSSDGFSTIEDYLILKYDENGTLLWVRNYNGTGDWLDRAQQAALDADGNLYVVGTSIGATSDWDYATVKYAPDGTQLWVERYNGPGNSLDVADSIVLDNAANVYITGVSYNADGIANYTTMRYTTNGDLVWIQRDTATASQNGEVLQLGLDSANNVYIAGSITDPLTGNDLAVRTYAATGEVLSVQQYNQAPNGDERTQRGARALFIDRANNIYVTGSSDANGTAMDYFTLKYQVTSEEPTTSPTNTTTVTPVSSSTPTAPTSTPTVTPTSTSSTTTVTPTSTSPTSTTTVTPTSTSPTSIPTATITPSGSEYSISINDGKLFTNKVNVILTINAKPGTTEMQVSNDGGFGDAVWEPYATHKPWQITQYGQSVLPRLVYIRYRDATGAVASSYQDDIILDVTPPTGRIRWSQQLAIAQATNSSPRLFLDASDDVSGVSDMRVSSKADFTDAVWQPFAASIAWDVSTPTVYVQFRDGAGNVSDTYAAPLTTPAQVFLPFVQN